MSRKLQQSQIHLNAQVLSETGLRRGTGLFTLKLCTLAITKNWVPVASERIWVFNAFLPFIHGTDDFIQSDTPL